jgi:diketogulonate reductase-like aldo/keto reductase
VKAAIGLHKPAQSTEGRNKKMKSLKLNNGYEIPCIGFGTFRIPDGKAASDAVENAIKAGYRHIDCAAIYDNEKGVGEGIAKSGVNREELFVTSKLWNDEKGYDKTMAAFGKTLDDLKLGYLDLYLIHWPVVKAFRENWKEANNETWRAFEELYKQGKIKALGVSNFLPHHLEPLMEYASVKPAVNQIEYHPGLMQEEAVAYCDKHGIVVEAWAPFSNSKLLSHPVISEVAAKYNKSTAQLILGWIIQKGVLPLPKSVTSERAKANLDVFDFELSASDMAKIDAITGVDRAEHPDHIDF